MTVLGESTEILVFDYSLRFSSVARADEREAEEIDAEYNASSPNASEPVASSPTNVTAPSPASSVNCSVVNASILYPTQCNSTNINGTAPAPLSFVAAYQLPSTVVSIAFGFGYLGINLLLVGALVTLIVFFKRKAKKPSRANPGGK